MYILGLQVGWTCTHGVIYTNYWRKEKYLSLLQKLSLTCVMFTSENPEAWKRDTNNLFHSWSEVWEVWLALDHKVLKVINHELRPTWQWQGRNIFDKHLARTRLLIISHDIWVNAGDSETQSIVYIPKVTKMCLQYKQS